MSDKIVEKARAVIAHELGVDVAMCRDDVAVLELGADSLDVISIVMSLEKRFNIDIWDEDLAKLRTVGDLVHYVRKCALAGGDTAADQEGGER